MRKAQNEAEVEPRNIFRRKWFGCCRLLTTDVEEDLLHRQIGRRPAHLVCSSCRSAVTTKVHFVVSERTRAMMSTFGRFLCCCLPLIMNRFKTAVHFCPVCHTFVGVDGH